MDRLPHPKTPCPQRGQTGRKIDARQVVCGKAEAVLNEINLERHLELERVFASLDIAAIRGELEVISGRAITEPGAILFLDEIQASPSALPALRYLCEDFPDIPIIAAESLLEFTLADHSFSMPVGRIVYHHLGPMTFGEFIQAIEPKLGVFLKNINFDTNPPSRQEIAHQVPVSGQNRKVTFELLSLPLYAVGEIERLLAQEQQ